MLILLAACQKMFSKKNYLSDIKYDVKLLMYGLYFITAAFDRTYFNRV